MDICSSCGKPLGSYQDCEACLKYMIEGGVEDIDEEGVRREGEGVCGRTEKHGLLEGGWGLPTMTVVTGFCL